MKFYQIPVPFNSDDYFFYGQRVSVNICPPIFTRPLSSKYFQPVYFRENLSSNEVKKGEQEIVTCEFDINDLDLMALRGPDGNIVEGYDTKLGDIVKVMVRKGK